MWVNMFQKMLYAFHVYFVEILEIILEYFENSNISFIFLESGLTWSCSENRLRWWRHTAISEVRKMRSPEEPFRKRWCPNSRAQTSSSPSCNSFVHFLVYEGRLISLQYACAGNVLEISAGFSFPISEQAALCCIDKRRPKSIIFPLTSNGAVAPAKIQLKHRPYELTQK